MYAAITLSKLPTSKITYILGIHKRIENYTQTLSKIVKILCCHKSQIYILQPIEYKKKFLKILIIRYLYIHGCTNCTIVTGAVKNILNIENCEQVTIIAPCKGLRLRYNIFHVLILKSNCSDVTLYVCVNNRPLLFGSANTGIQFAPYNTYFESLEQQLQISGIDTRLNQFNNPFKGFLFQNLRLIIR